MSSFKRKTTTKSAKPIPGTRPSPSSSTTLITSTGVPSLDDILGGGLPLSCSLAILAPDLHSRYGDLVQKYFISQGLSSGQSVVVIDQEAESLVKECMWIQPTSNFASTHPKSDPNDSEKIKIAWRYEQMKQFETTVNSSASSTDNYCSAFDLTCRIPESVVDDAVHSGQLTYWDINSESSTVDIIRRLSEFLRSCTATNAVRICIPSLGSPQWGDHTSEDICYFLHSLRALLRVYPFTCASYALSPDLSTDESQGLGWAQKVAWFSDAAVTMSAFTANPSLSATFPSHHGLFGILTLPAPHTLIAASDKFSTLRGISSSSGSGGGGENNLAFKCTRKRLVIETLHLDLEGGVRERRTTAPDVVVPVADATIRPLALAEVTVELETLSTSIAPSEPEIGAVKPKKARKKVAFHSDRPELYDF